MPLTKSEKELLVKELNQNFETSSAVFIVHYKGVNVTEITELRDQVRQTGGQYQVSKNTLFKLAAKGTHVEGLTDEFKGPCAAAMAFDDPVAMAKLLMKFSEDVEDFKIQSGVLNGNILDLNAIEALSKLPSREVLIAKLLSVLVATPTNLVQVLSGIPRKLLYALKALEEQKG